MTWRASLERHLIRCVDRSKVVACFFMTLTDRALFQVIISWLADPNNATSTVSLPFNAAGNTDQDAQLNCPNNTGTSSSAARLRLLWRSPVSRWAEALRRGPRGRELVGSADPSSPSQIQLGFVITPALAFASASALPSVLPATSPNLNSSLTGSPSPAVSTAPDSLESQAARAQHVYALLLAAEEFDGGLLPPDDFAQTLVSAYSILLKY